MCLRPFVVGFLWVSGAVSQMSPDIASGKRLFSAQCALCHGHEGTGGRGPTLIRPDFEKAPDDAALRKLISQGIQPEMPGAWQLSEREVANVAAYVKTLGAITTSPLPGDAARGQRLYEREGCASCHIIRGRGEGYGPELTSIGTLRHPVHLRESIVKPSVVVAEEFVQAVATPGAGAPVRGLRASEDPFTIQVRDAKGTFHSFRKRDLKELKKLRQESVMPAYDRLTATELDDLVAYLASLRRKP